MSDKKHLLIAIVLGWGEEERFKDAMDVFVAAVAAVAGRVPAGILKANDRALLVLAADGEPDAFLASLTARLRGTVFNFGSNGGRGQDTIVVVRYDAFAATDLATRVALAL